MMNKIKFAGISLAMFMALGLAACGDTASESKAETTKAAETTAAAETEEAMRPLNDVEGKDIIIDCTQLEYISSAGLRIFLGILQNAQEKGGHVHVEVSQILSGQEDCHEAVLLLETLRLGLEEIRDTYGSRYLTISTIRK